MIYKTPSKDGMLSLVKDFLAVVVLAEMDNFICPYVLQIAKLLSDATVGECTPLGDQAQMYSKTWYIIVLFPTRKRIECSHSNSGRGPW